MIELACKACVFTLRLIAFTAAMGLGYVFLVLLYVVMT